MEKESPRTQPYFITFYLHDSTKKHVLRKLAPFGTLNLETYPSHVYEKVASRFANVYNRLKQYPKNFIASWKSTVSPGVLVYVAEGETIDVLKQKKKRMISEAELSGLLLQGYTVVYYGNQNFSTFEAYITSKRLSAERERGFLNDLPIFSSSILMAIDIAPFLPGSNIISVGSLSVLARSPRYLSSLDSLIGGIVLFNVDGTLLPTTHRLFTPTRYVCPVQYSTYTLVSSKQDLLPHDIYCIPPDFLVPPQLNSMVSSITSEAKRMKLRVLGESGLTEVRLVSKQNTFTLYTYLCIKKPIELNGLSEHMLKTLLISSYGFTVKIDPIDVETMSAIVPIRAVTKEMSLCFISTLLQLRKTVLFDQEMGILVIAPKASLKSSVISLIKTLLPSIPIVDSDVYGRWITSVIEKRLVPLDVLSDDDCSVESFFEIMAKQLLQSQFSYQERIDSFREAYATTLSNEKYGIAKFQEYIFSTCGTTRVICFLHTTVEANLMSGKWQHILIRPIHDTAAAVQARNRKNKDENVFLHAMYLGMTTYSNRSAIPWIDFFLLLSPAHAINEMNVLFRGRINP